MIKAKKPRFENNFRIITRATGRNRASDDMIPSRECEFICKGLLRIRNNTNLVSL
jgi:hypothetical protein